MRGKGMRPSRPLRSPLVSALLAGVLGAAAFFASCPGDDGGSAGTGPAQTVPLRFEAALPPGGALGGASSGWTVALTRAEIALGSVTVYGNSTYEAVAAATPSWAPLRFGGAPAWAHAGHAHGEADAEAALDGFFVLDLLADGGVSPGSLALPPALYFDGKLKLAKAAADGTFTRPGGGAVAADDPMLGHTLLLEGTATDASGGAHDLRVVVDAEGWVAGLAFDFPVAEGAAPALSITVRIDALLGAIDLGAALNADGAIVVGPQETGAAADYTGLKAALATATTYVQTDLMQ